MNKEISTKDLISELVKRLHIQYGSLEIKIHDGNWTNYQVTTRVNFNESDTKDLFIKEL